MYPVKNSTAVTIPIFVHDVSGDAVTGLVDAGFTKRISKNGGAFAAMTVTITEMENGFYSVPLSSSHTDTNGILTMLFTHGSAKQINLQFRVHARLPDDMAFPTTSGRSIDVATTGEVGLDYGNTTGGPPAVNVTQLGGVAQSLTDLKDFADAGYDPATNKVEGVKVVDTTTANTDMRGTDSAALAVNYTAGRASNLDNLDATVSSRSTVAATDIVSAGAITTLSGAVVNVDTVDTTTTNTDMRGTDNAALASVCTEARLSELDAATGGKMANQVDIIQTDTTTDIPAQITGLNDPTAASIADAVWDEPRAGHTTAGTYGQNTGDAAMRGTDGVDTAPMRGTDSAALASICTEARLAELDAANLPADVAANATPAEVNAEVVDVLKTDVITLPGQVAPPLTPTFEQAVSWLYKVLRNRKTQTATQWSLLADDETTVDAKATVSDDATTAIKQEIVAGP